MLRRKIFGVFVLYAFLLPTFAFAQTAKSIYEAPKAEIDRIKDEGMNRSRVMQHLGYLTDVIGGRLTNSPNMKRANEWTRDTMAKWGMVNAKLEPWGPFGRGWSLKGFSAQVIHPQSMPLVAYPKAWSPGTDTLSTTPGSSAYTGDVVYYDPKDEADLARFKGQLKGKLVLVTPIREVKAWFDSPGKRFSDSELLDMANAQAPGGGGGGGQQFAPSAEQARNAQFSQQRFRFAVEEGAAILLDTSFKGDGGTLFVSGAAVLQDANAGPGQNKRSADKDANVPVQVTLSTEHYNRIVRLLQQGEKVRATIDLKVEFQDDDLMGYNTVAEIPGTDLKDEIVMLGAHMDSWHAGTGATDNASGTSVMMEAVRIIQTLGLKPRRTIRIGLWSGEEQGLLGSRAYVGQQFASRGTGGGGAGPGGGGGQQQPLVKKADYDKFSAYYNLDNGTGKIRGVYMQGNEAVRPIFRRWLLPFKDMGATTLTISNTGGTDHLAFDAVGLPGFQFIQDPVEYSTRSHHSNMDVFDRIQADDMKQASTIMAAFVYQTAMMDEKIPRKPMP